MLWVSMQAGQDCGQLGPGQPGLQMHFAIRVTKHDAVLEKVIGSRFDFGF